MIWRAVAIIVAAYLLSLPVAAQEIPLRNGLSLAYGSPAAPALSLDGVDERRHTLEALRGQVVVVNFWATWCPPCIAEMPAMQRMYELLHEDGLEVLAINAGQDAETIGAFLSEFEVALTFPVLLDPKGEAFEAWGARGLPKTYVVDKAGHLAYVAEGGREMDSEHIIALLRALIER